MTFSGTTFLELFGTKTFFFFSCSRLKMSVNTFSLVCFWSKRATGFKISGQLFTDCKTLFPWVSTQALYQLLLKYSCVLPGISPSFKPFVLLTDHPSNQDGLRIGSPRWEFFWFFCLNEQKLPVASLEGRGRLISLLTLPKLQKQERVYSSLKSLCCIAETTQHYKSTALQRKKKKGLLIKLLVVSHTQIPDA